MSSTNKIKKLLSSVTGLDKAIVDSNTAHFQKQVMVQGATMVWAPLVAAILVFIGINTVYQSWPAALLSAIFVAAIIYMVDLYATMRLGKPSWQNYLMRVALFLGLVALDVICLELVINDAQIRTEANNRFDDDQEAAAAQLLVSMDSLEGMRTLLYVEKVKLTKEQTNRLQVIEDEINGKGSTNEIGDGDVSLALQRQYDKFLEAHIPLVEANLLRIGEVSTEVKTLHLEIEGVKNAPFLYSSIGPGERISILHYLSNQPNGWSIRLIFFIITTLIFVSDFLPIFHRKSMDFEQYLLHHTAKRKLMISRKDKEASNREIGLSDDYKLRHLDAKLDLMDKTLRKTFMAKRKERRAKYEEVRMRQQEANTYNRIIVHDHVKAMKFTRSEEERNVLQDNFSRALRDLEDIALDDLLDNLHSNTPN